MNKNDFNEGAASDEKEWYYFWDGQKRGPVTLQELESLLRSGKVTLYVKVWKIGLQEWIPIQESGLDCSTYLGQRPKPNVSEFSIKRVVTGVLGFFALFVLFMVVLGLVLNHLPSSSPEGEAQSGGGLNTMMKRNPMPLTVEAYQEFDKHFNDLMNEVYSSSFTAELTSNDLTQPAKSTLEFEGDKRFQKSSVNRHIVNKMGYDFPATLVEISLHKEALEKRIVGLGFISMGEAAFKEVNALQEAGVIDKVTAEKLTEAFGAK